MGVRAVEKGREGSKVKGKAGYSGTGILFLFLESPELALNSKGSLLCFWCRQINVNLLLLLSLLGIASSPLFLWASCLVGCWGCFGVKLAHRGGQTGRAGRETCRGDKGHSGCTGDGRKLPGSEAGAPLMRRGELVRRAAAPVPAPQLQALSSPPGVPFRPQIGRAHV